MLGNEVGEPVGFRIKTWAPVMGVFLSLVAVGSAVAADLDTTMRTAICTVSPQSNIQSLPDAQFRATLERNYDVAKSELADRSTLYSRSMRYIWAHEAKVQCAQALGYLKGGSRDTESSQKCDCFTQHMARF